MKKKNYLSEECFSGFEAEAYCGNRVTSYRATALALAVSCLLFPLRVAAQAGALDMTFAPRIAAPTDSVGPVTLQPDGKLIVNGFFRIVGTALLGPDTTHLVRLNPDGTLDGSFNAVLDPRVNPAAVRTAILQADGRIVLSLSQSIIIRLQPDGSLDPSLYLSNYVVTNNPFSGVYYTVVSAPNGKLIVGGKFSDTSRQRFHYLIRVNSDGTLDTGFNPDIGSSGPENYVTVAALQPDGKILIGGPHGRKGQKNLLHGCHE